MADEFVADNDKIVSFTEDEKTRVLQLSKEMSLASRQLFELVTKNELTVAMKHVLPELMETHFTTLTHVLGHESVLAKEHDERHADIRKAHLRIRELEHQLAQQRPLDGLREQIYELYRTVYDWWRFSGFGHIHEFYLTKVGSFYVQFSFMLDTHADSILSETPATDRKKKQSHVQSLVNDGFELIPDSLSGYYWHLLDTPKNRQLVVELVKKRFPSIQIPEFQSQSRNLWGKETFIISEMVAYIHNAEDIPAPSNDELRAG